jgi:hypothetical protein
MVITGLTSFSSIAKTVAASSGLGTSNIALKFHHCAEVRCTPLSSLSALSECWRHHGFKIRSGK